MKEFEDVDPKDMENLLNFMNSLDDDGSEPDYEFLMKNLGLDLDELEEEMNDYTPQLEMGFMKSHPDSVDPKYIYNSDSGFDLYSTEEIWIHPFDRKLIPTGLHVDIPEGYELQVRSKSGLALKQGLMVLNSPGTVDQGYLGEIQVILFNTTNDRIKIEKGQKVGQAVLCPVVSGKWIKLIEKTELGEKDRNNNGFGSTGI